MAGQANFIDGWRPLAGFGAGSKKLKGTVYDPNTHRDQETVRERKRLKRKGKKLDKDTSYYPSNQGMFNNFVKNNEFDQALPKDHPFNDPLNHDKLLRHCIERIQLARETRDQFAIRLRTVDLDINGFLRLSEEDKERLRHNRQGRSPKPIAVNLPLVLAKIDELLTFLLEVFWPNEGMYSAYATKKNQPIANGFSQLLNKQAERKQHYHKFARFLFDALKYNFGALEVCWCVDKGYKLTNDAAKRVKKEDYVWEGNDITNIDLYNFFWDPSVHPVDIPTKGEYCAYVELVSKFMAKKLQAGGYLHGVDRFIDNVNDYSVSYYYEKPIVRFDYNSYTGSVDWMRFASGGKYQTIGTGIELITMYIWLDPSEYGLSTDEEYQIWRIVLANHQYVVHAEHMNNAHNEIPVKITVPYADGLGLQMKSAAEQIMDFQRFASFLMNVHQTASRKSLYGKLIYDPSMIDMGAEDEVGGRFPVNPAGYGKDLSKSFINLTDTPKTEKTLEDIKAIMEMMEVVMPTNILKQVADLDRATTYQAAATVQGANRRSLKLAKVIEDQAVRGMKFQMMYNVLQYQKAITIIDQTGNEVQVDPSQFREIEIEFAVSAGLQNLDKLMVIHLMQEVINSVLQSQQAAQEIDIVALLNYWTNLIGDKTDLNQFRRQQPTPQQQLEQQQQQEAEQQGQHDRAVGAIGAANDVAAAKAKSGAGAGALQPGAQGS